MRDRSIEAATRRWLGVAIGLLLALASNGAATAEGDGRGIASQWVVEQASRARLVAGGVGLPGGRTKVYAGLEIRLEDGWKTYWRNPGASGVPPRVDFTGSENLAKAELLFPAPIRFPDRDGDTIGYKASVVLPVALEPIDPTKPIVLKVAAEFGICRDVCIPVQPTLSLDLPADAASRPATAGLPEAIAKVPVANSTLANSPRIERISATLSGPKPVLVIDAMFPGATTGTDIFLEAPEGIWVPLPKPAGSSPGGASRFVVDLTDGADLADLKGRPIRATLVSPVGQSETTFDLVEAR